MRVQSSMVPKVPRYEPMTGTTQTPWKPSIDRPANGIRSMREQEWFIDQQLRQLDVEKVVETHWHSQGPEQIAANLRVLYPQTLLFMTAKWVESIKRRIDNRKRRD